MSPPSRLAHVVPRLPASLRAACCQSYFPLRSRESGMAFRTAVSSSLSGCLPHPPFRSWSRSLAPFRASLSAHASSVRAASQQRSPAPRLWCMQEQGLGRGTRTPRIRSAGPARTEGAAPADPRAAGGGCRRCRPGLSRTALWPECDKTNSVRTLQRRVFRGFTGRAVSLSDRAGIRTWGCAAI